MGLSVVAAVVVVASVVVLDFPNELTVVARLSLLIYPYMGLWAGLFSVIPQFLT